MSRYVLRRLALIPLVLTVVNFFGFAYAHLVQPGQIGRNPFLAVTAEPTPVLPAYFDYLSDVFHGDLGALPRPARRWGRSSSRRRSPASGCWRSRLS